MSQRRRTLRKISGRREIPGRRQLRRCRLLLGGWPDGDDVPTRSALLPVRGAGLLHRDKQLDVHPVTSDVDERVGGTGYESVPHERTVDASTRECIKYYYQLPIKLVDSL